MTYAEALDKIAYLKQEHIDAITRLKWRKGLLQCFVVAAPAFVKSMVRLKFKANSRNTV